MTAPVVETRTKESIEEEDERGIQMIHERLPGGFSYAASPEAEAASAERKGNRLHEAKSTAEGKAHSTAMVTAEGLETKETKAEAKARISAEKKAKHLERVALRGGGGGGLPTPLMEVHVVGLSHHLAPVEVREKLALKMSDWNAYAQELVNFAWTAQGQLVPEVAVLSTCNRFEVYFASKELSETAAMQKVHAFLQHKSGLSEAELGPYLFSSSGTGAIRHLFEVASGLDSLVLGEAQVLGQVKTCYEQSIIQPPQQSGMKPSHLNELSDQQDEAIVPGSGGKVIARMLNYGIKIGKLARTHTGIGQGCVSVSSAAVELMILKAANDLQKNPEDLDVSIIGAGCMSKRLLQALYGKLPNIRLSLVNRNMDNARALLSEVACKDGACHATEVVPLERMRDVIRESDVVITASSSETPIISADDLQGINRKLMLVDIAVPRNVHSNVFEVEGVHSYSVDDLAKIQEANNKARQAEVLKTNVLIDEQLQKFQEWHLQRAQFTALAQEVKKIPVELAKVPVELAKVPVELAKVPVELAKVPGEFAKIPGAFAKIPGAIAAVHQVELAKVPVELAKVPVELAKVPVELAKVPVELAKVPGEFAKIPGAIAKVAPAIEQVARVNQ
jgi:glutamyl-tRNA reductase